MKIRFWGTRGSIPAPGPETIKYGGNTSCVEIQLNDGTLLIFDAGTGIRKLGLALTKARQKQPINLFLTHSHWDHIQGFPFFLPAYEPDIQIHIYGGPPAYVKLKEILTDQMESKFFPVNFEDLNSQITFTEIDQGAHAINSVRISLLETNHPGKAYGFKLEEERRSMVFLTDNELQPPYRPTTSYDDFVRFCNHTDLLIHDAMWTEEELSTRRGWGHSSFEQVVQLGLDAQVKRLVLFHHDPEHSDTELDTFHRMSLKKISAEGAKMKCYMAQEGMTLEF